jgi:catechol 2,3-dioxygenase-like lactoylglutathione lyase family enzyme
MRLSGAMLFAADLEAQTAFYRDVIGFRPIEATRLDDWVEFDTGSTRFALHAIPPQLGVRPDPAPRETAGCKLILEVENADVELDRLNAAGVTILHRAWGGWDFADPEGNVLGVRERGPA